MAFRIPSVKAFASFSPKDKHSLRNLMNDWRVLGAAAAQFWGVRHLGCGIEFALPKQKNCRVSTRRQESAMIAKPGVISLLGRFRSALAPSSRGCILSKGMLS